MVAIPVFSQSHKPKQTLFNCLTPCQPAPGIAPAPVADAFDRPRRLSKRQRRWLIFAFGATHAMAVGLSLWVTAMGSQIKPKIGTQTLGQPTAATTKTSAEERLWAYLGSEAYARDQMAGRLAAAEQERLHAQQLRITAEEEAENIIATAAQRARNTKKAAIQQADAIRLDATFIGAEQIIYGEAGDSVTLKFAARVQCKAGTFGETAIALPVDERITPREVRNLGTCFPREQTPAGEPVGEIGEWGVGFFKLD
ncbi:MAG: hypothetical protein AAFR58_07500 [Cyanobacteria bacterium J06627_28]